VNIPCIGYGSLLQYRAVSLQKQLRQRLLQSLRLQVRGVRKKDLGLMAMSYGYVYVAQIAMGANMNQTIKAMVEAESYKGPSLIIAYSPCISHGIKTGMGTSIFEEKRAVEAGYWHLYRYNPMLKEQGKNPFYSGVERTDHSLQGVPQGRNQIFTACECIPGCGGRNV